MDMADADVQERAYGLYVCFNGTFPVWGKGKKLSLSLLFACFLVFLHSNTSYGLGRMERTAKIAAIEEDEAIRGTVYP